MTDDSDIELIAAQIADLTHVVAGLADQVQRLVAASATQLTRADEQQERIDRAASELTEVTDRLHAAANALRQAS